MTACILAALPFADFLPIIIIFVISAIRLLTTALNKGQPPIRRPPNPLPGQPAARPGGETLEGEIEEFLRRAAARREGQQQGGPAGARPAVPKTVVVVRGVEPRVVRRPPPPPAVSRPVPTPPIAPASREMAPPQTSLAEHHLDTSEISERAGNLTSLGNHERQFEQQVQQSFAHHVGSLGASVLSATPNAEAKSATAPEAVRMLHGTRTTAMLRHPGGLQAAVVLNEILQRPEHRW